MVVILAAMAEVPFTAMLVVALTAALMSAVPVTTKAARLLTAPLKTPFPVTVRLLLLPVNVPLNVTADPARVTAEAEFSVTLPE